MWQLEDWKKSLKKIDDKFDIGAGNVWVRPQHSPTMLPPHAYRRCREIERSSPTHMYDGTHIQSQNEMEFLGKFNIQCPQSNQMLVRVKPTKVRCVPSLRSINNPRHYCSHEWSPMITARRRAGLCNRPGWGKSCR